MVSGERGYQIVFSLHIQKRNSWSNLFPPTKLYLQFFLNCFLLFYIWDSISLDLDLTPKLRQALNFQASYFNIWNNWVHKPESPGLSSSIFIFLRNRLTLLHKGSMNFHSYQQCTRGLFLQGGPQHHTVNLNNTWVSVVNCASTKLEEKEKKTSQASKAARWSESSSEAAGSWAAVLAHYGCFYQE